MIDQKTINEIRSFIVKEYQPEKIILFGSYANGIPTEDSDLDLLIVLDINLPQPRRNLKIKKDLRRWKIAKDLIVKTPEEFNNYKDIVGSIIHTACVEGRILYER
ncbi:nucleotidyltransferase domain-containing protein [Candidatus Poribacteria bacterium]|nr:nucleotidyltransferase domain-containing protein [Candidatus Poribacteria bacterium]